MSKRKSVGMEKKGGIGMETPTSKGIWGAIFDFSFSEFITTRIVKFLYGLTAIVVGLISLVGIISGFSQGFGVGLLALILSPLYFLLMLIGARIWLELIIVVFRIAEHVGEIADRGEPVIHEEVRDGTTR